MKSFIVCTYVGSASIEHF